MERRREKILVVDDSPAITRLLASVLTQEGYHVVTTNQPKQAEVLVRSESPDLVVLDVCMPGIDGWELCRRIRSEHRMPILILTVLGDAADIERTFRAGADAYMTKPFVINELLERIQRLLNRKIRRLKV